MKRLVLLAMLTMWATQADACHYFRYWHFHGKQWCLPGDREPYRRIVAKPPAVVRVAMQRPAAILQPAVLTDDRAHAIGIELLKKAMSQ